MQRCKLVVLLTLAMMGSSAYAELPFYPQETTVIHNSGNVTPISEYLNDEQLLNFKSPAKDLPSVAEIEKALHTVRTQHPIPSDSSELLAKLFPIIPTQLQARKLVSKYQQVQIDYLKSPIFIIGADEYSLSWFRVNKKELQRVGAIGVLAQANTLEDYLAIQEICRPLEVLPSGIDAIAEQFNIPAYPILITSNGFYQ